MYFIKFQTLKKTHLFFEIKDDYLPSFNSIQKHNFCQSCDRFEGFLE